LELRLLSFSTGQPHPLAEQTVIFIDKKVFPLDTWGVQIKIVGNFLILLTTFLKSSGNKDIFVLVCWKSGLIHCVSIRFEITANSGLSTIADVFAFSSHLPNGVLIDISLTSRKTPS
jgi:hypothetical protein